MNSLEEQLSKSFLWLERLRPETQEVIKIQLAKAQKEIILLVADTDNIATIRAEINKILNDAFATFETTLLVDKDNITELTYNATQNIMATWTTIEAIKLTDATKKVQKTLSNPNILIQGHTLDNQLKHLNSITTRKLQGQIAQGFEQGQGIQEITRTIRNTFGNLERNQLNTLTRTMLLESIRDAQNETFDYFEKEITEYYYNSVLDTRTTPRCWNLNGTSSKNKQDIIKLLNFHYNCRSILGVRTDLSKEFDENAEQNIIEWNSKTVNHRDGTKSSKFKVNNVKQVYVNASPETAFKALSTKFQREYMGATRYKLWQNGKASFADMVSKTRNTFIPLDQLRQKLNLN